MIKLWHAKEEEKEEEDHNSTRRKKMLIEKEPKIEKYSILGITFMKFTKPAQCIVI